MSTTTDPNDPRLGHGSDDEPGPQNEVYLVLSDEERHKGLVRPLRYSYIHVGQRCNSLTTINNPEIAETFAREPAFYSSTYCCACRKHLPVQEFVWKDGSRVGS